MAWSDHVRHDIVAEGPAFRLRPVELADAAFIVALRGSGERSRFLHPISPDVGAQVEYLRGYFERASDYYFIIERKHDESAEGTIGIYDVDGATRSGEWGRWILCSGSGAAVESVWLLYRVAFARLELERLYCRTIEKNTKVVSFHNSSGLRLHRHLPKHVLLRGRAYDAVEHEILRTEWPRIDAMLGDRSARFARLLAGTRVSSQRRDAQRLSDSRDVAGAGERFEHRGNGGAAASPPEGSTCE
jgi:RimJ/RimL family protein N-acetyltransferase